MPAYMFFDIVEISDPAVMQSYGQQIRPLVHHYGGHYRVAGGTTEVLEGDWRPTLPIIIEFPSVEQAHLWYASEAYQQLIALRAGAAKVNGVLIEGVG